jgi:hypothetical protein
LDELFQGGVAAGTDLDAEAVESHKHGLLVDRVARHAAGKQPWRARVGRGGHVGPALEEGQQHRAERCRQGNELRVEADGDVRAVDGDVIDFELGDPGDWLRIEQQQGADHAVGGVDLVVGQQHADQLNPPFLGEGVQGASLGWRHLHALDSSVAGGPEDEAFDHAPGSRSGRKPLVKICLAARVQGDVTLPEPGEELDRDRGLLLGVADRPAAELAGGLLVAEAAQVVPADEGLDGLPIIEVAEHVQPGRVELHDLAGPAGVGAGVAALGRLALLRRVRAWSNA